MSRRPTLYFFLAFSAVGVDAKPAWRLAWSFFVVVLAVSFWFFSRCLFFGDLSPTVTSLSMAEHTRRPG